MTVKLSHAGGVPRELADPLNFEPGETRHVEWRLSKGCVVNGRTIDASGLVVVPRGGRREFLRGIEEF